MNHVDIKDEPIVVPLLRMLLAKGNTINCDLRFAADFCSDWFKGRLCAITYNSGNYYTLQLHQKIIAHWADPSQISMGPAAVERLELTQRTDGTWTLTYEEPNRS